MKVYSVKRKDLFHDDLSARFSKTYNAFRGDSNRIGVLDVATFGATRVVDAGIRQAGKAVLSNNSSTVQLAAGLAGLAILLPLKGARKVAAAALTGVVAPVVVATHYAAKHHTQKQAKAINQGDLGVRADQIRSCEAKRDDDSGQFTLHITTHDAVYRNDIREVAVEPQNAQQRKAVLALYRGHYNNRAGHQLNAAQKDCDQQLQKELKALRGESTPLLAGRR